MKPAPFTVIVFPPPDGPDTGEVVVAVNANVTVVALFMIAKPLPITFTVKP